VDDAKSKIIALVVWFDFDLFNIEEPSSVHSLWREFGMRYSRRYPIGFAKETGKFLHFLRYFIGKLKEIPREALQQVAIEVTHALTVMQDRELNRKAPFLQFESILASLPKISLLCGLKQALALASVENESRGIDYATLFTVRVLYYCTYFPLGSSRESCNKTRRPGALLIDQEVARSKGQSHVFRRR
jgi:hypothetical protein